MLCPRPVLSTHYPNPSPEGSLLLRLTKLTRLESISFHTVSCSLPQDGWPWTSDPPASTPWVPGLLLCTTIPSHGWFLTPPPMISFLLTPWYLSSPTQLYLSGVRGPSGPFLPPVQTTLVEFWATALLVSLPSIWTFCLFPNAVTSGSSLNAFTSPGFCAGSLPISQPPDPIHSLKFFILPWILFRGSGERRW